MRLRHRWYPPPHLISYRIANPGPKTTPGVPVCELVFRGCPVPESGALWVGNRGRKPHGKPLQRSGSSRTAGV